MARPRSRVRPLETPGNRRPREMTVGSRQRLPQDPAYRPSLALFLSANDLPAIYLPARSEAAVASASRRFFGRRLLASVLHRDERGGTSDGSGMLVLRSADPRRTALREPAERSHRRARNLRAARHLGRRRRHVRGHGQGGLAASPRLRRRAMGSGLDLEPVHHADVTAEPGRLAAHDAEHGLAKHSRSHRSPQLDQQRRTLRR